MVQNPSLSKTSSQNVVTYDGTIAPKEKCRKIKDEYYIVGDPKVKGSGQCYKVSGKYVRINSGLIAFDEELKKYNRISNMVKGGIAINKEGNIAVGYFTPDESKNVVITGKEEQGVNYYMNIDDLEKLGCYNPDFGKYVVGSDMKAQIRNNKELRFTSKPDYKSHYNTGLYGAIGNPSFEKSINSHKKYLPKLKINKSLTRFERFLDGHTFGLEIETTRGGIPIPFMERYGVFPVRDGSIAGHEFVTVPYKGVEGLSTIEQLFKLFQRYTVTDQFCSLHIHFGNLFTETDSDDYLLFIVAFYMLAQRTQFEIREFLPPYKKDMQYLMSKRNNGTVDHCKDLNMLGLNDMEILDKDGSVNKGNLNAAISTLVRFLNENNNIGYAATKIKNGDVLTHVKEGRNKWEWLGRYYHTNLIPLLFKEMRTIEFRYHSGTVNPTKAINWLFICNALIRYAKTYPKKIIAGKEKITLYDIVEEYATNFGKRRSEEGQFLANYLREYILSRRKESIASFMKSDVYGQEFKNDNKYTFQMNGVDLFNYVR